MRRVPATIVAVAMTAGCSAASSPLSSPPSQAPVKWASATSGPPPTVSRSTAAPAVVHQPRHEHYAYPIKGCSSSPSASHHDYPASDIFTQKGCKFVAVTSGVVDEVSRKDRWDPQVNAGATRGGLSVSIVGDDGVRYYGSHLLRIAPGIHHGARVHAGQLLGLVDNSGDARYTPTHVHFGISWPSRKGKWWVRRGEVWPQQYLTAWRNGHDLSPAREVRRVHRRVGNVPHCTVLC